MKSADEFEAFVRESSTALLRIAHLLSGDTHDAEEILQEALVKAAIRWERARENPQAYVRITMVNLLRDRWRRHRIRRELPFSHEQLQATERRFLGSDGSESTVERLALREAVRGLPRRQREVIIYRYYLDASVDQSARELGISQGSVKAYTNRALDSLRCAVQNPFRGNTQSDWSKL